MIIKQKSLNHILKSIKLLNGVFAAGLFIIIAVFFFHFPKADEAQTLNLSSLNIKGGPSVSRFDNDQIGKGVLALHSEIQSFPFPDLSGEVLFLAKNTRPDASFYEIKLQIGLKGSKNSLTLTPGQTLYLAYDQQYLNFSNEVTPLWIKPKLDEKGEVWLEMGIELFGEGGEKLLDEMREFKVAQKWSTKEFDEVLDPHLKLGAEILKGGKWWGPDKLYESYGGEEYLKYKGCERLEIEMEKGREILFIKEGNTYVWKEGKWTHSTETKGYPMAKVLAVSPYKIEWQLWDKGGMESVLLTYNRERPSGISLRVEDVFSRMRRRTSSRVSCRIDNRATILKEGDWLVHTPTGWHTIKNYYEVEEVLSLGVLGELFIFDGLEKVDGKEVFCGTLFNTMRTQEQHVRLPMTQNKSGEHSPPTKSTFSSKIGPLAPEETSTAKGQPKHSHKTIEEFDIFGED